jgi:hypothetical protein
VFVNILFTWPSLNIVPDALDHVLVLDPELLALVQQAGQDDLLGVAVDDSSGVATLNMFTSWVKFG